MSCIAAAFPSVATHVSSVTVRLGSSRRTCPRSHGFRNSRIAVGSLVRLLLRITQYSHLLIALRSLRCNRPWSVWHHRGLPNPGHCPPPVVSLPITIHSPVRLVAASSRNMAITHSEALRHVQRRVVFAQCWHSAQRRLHICKDACTYTRCTYKHTPIMRSSITWHLHVHIRIYVYIYIYIYI